MNSRRLIDAPEAQDRPSYRLKPAYWKGPPNVRFGSLTDICAAKSDVRFTPESGRVRRNERCLLCAISGHRPTTIRIYVIPVARQRGVRRLEMPRARARSSHLTIIGCNERLAVIPAIEPRQL